jgi:hypothetical protein
MLFLCYTSDSSNRLSELKGENLFMLAEEKKIKQLKQKLMNLGPIHPGSINKQFNVCGKAVCKCKDPKNPIKHGPYYQLSYTVAGKSSSKFLKEEELPEAKRQVERYKEFKKLIVEIAKSSVDSAKKTGFQRR